MASDAIVDIEVILKNGRTFNLKVDQAFANRGVTKDFLLKACQQSKYEVSADDFEDAIINIGHASEKRSGLPGSGDPEPVAYFTPKYNASGFQWTSIAVKNLIATCKELQSKFHNPDIMKREAWGMVAAVMKRKGFSLTGGQCDEKMRNLRYRHKVLSDKRQKEGRLVIRWQHMEDMDDLMAGRPAEEPPSLHEADGDLTAVMTAEESAEVPEGTAGQSSSAVSKTVTSPIVRRRTWNTTKDCSVDERSKESTRSASAESTLDESVESLLGNSSASFQGPFWSKMAVKHLIATYKAMQDKFSSRDIMKREAWDVVARVLGTKGFLFSGWQCAEKMRSLTFRYKQICKKRQNAKKGEVIQWRYLADMDDLMDGVSTDEPVAHASDPRTTCNVAKDNDDKFVGEELWEHRQESQDKTAEKIKLAITKTKDVVKQVTKNKNGGNPQKEESTELVGSAGHESDSGNPASVSGGQWSSQVVRCLIETYKNLQKEFHYHDLKKREAWDMVAEVMETKGYQVTGLQVQDKMRNLKSRHKLLLGRMRKAGGDKGRTKWKYMQDMNELMAAEEPVVEPVALIKVNHSDMSSDVGDDNMDDGGESSEEEDLEHSQRLQEPTAEEKQLAETRTLRRCSRLKAKSEENPISFAEAESDGDEDPESPPGMSVSGGLRSSVAVKLLIETYRSLRGKFNSTSVRKRQAWKMVAAAMRKKGFQVTGLQCDNKMRYLRFRHRLRDKKREKFGSKRLRYWVHMEDMDRLVAEEQGMEPPALTKGRGTGASSDVADGDDDDNGDGDESAREERWEHKREAKKKAGENKEADSAPKTLAPVLRCRSRISGEGSSLEETSEDLAPVAKPESALGENNERVTRISMSGGHWSSRAVKCLIAAYRALQNKFHSPYITKIRAWQMVAASMRRKGYPVTGSLCNAKMRSLRFRYKLIKDKGRQRQRFWEHLGDMHDLMEREGGASHPASVVRVNNSRAVSSDDSVVDQSAGAAAGQGGQEEQEGSQKRAASNIKQMTRTQSRGSSKDSARVLKVESAADENQELSPFAGAQWSSSAVKYLIATYKALQSEFQNPDIMKKDAWEMVAALMKKKGFRVTGSQCDDKMRNLKFRHKMVTLRKQEKQTGKGYKNRWEHLEDMDNLMSGGPPVEPMVSLVKVDHDEVDTKVHMGGGDVSDNESAGEDSWSHSADLLQNETAVNNSSVFTKTASTRTTSDLTLKPSGSVRMEKKRHSVSGTSDAKGLCFPSESGSAHTSASKEAIRQLVIDGDVYRRWHQLRTSQDISSDSLMAAFLLQYYEKNHLQESGVSCTSCGRALPPVCSTCGLAQQNGNASVAPAEARDQPPGSSVDAKKEGRSKGKESGNVDLKSWEATSSSFQSPDSGLFRVVSKATTSARSLPSSSEDGQLFTNLCPVSQDQVQAGKFSLLSSGDHQALTAPETRAVSDPSLLPVADVRVSGEAYPVKLFQVDDPNQVAVSAMFTNCVRESVMMPRRPAVPQENRATAESDSEHGGYDMNEEEEEEEDSGRMEEDRAVAGTSGEIEQDVKDSLDVSLAELSKVLMTRRLPRYRAARKTWGPPPYLCQECGLSFDKSSNLVRHIYKHTGEYPYPCPECDSAFVTRTELDHHFRKHTGEKPFLCPICGTAYSRSCNLETHMRTHTGERPYKCEFCSAQFTTSSARSRHQRMHTGEKPYVCSQCNAAFQQLNMLKVHQYQHTGIRAFQCQKCGIAFYRKSSLRRHMRRVQCTKQ